MMTSQPNRRATVQRCNQSAVTEKKRKTTMAADDPRLGSLVVDCSGAAIPRGADICIIGFPHDEGVRRNKGRVGAAAGPAHFRERYRPMGTLVNPEFGCDLTTLRIVDAGDIDASLELEAAHAQLTARVAEALAAGCVPFVIGGGNDQSYANAAGLLQHLHQHAPTVSSTSPPSPSPLHGSVPPDICADPPSVLVINIDAHLDVRPLRDGQAHSGSPFRLLIEDARFANGRLVEFAAQGSQCSQAHVDYLASMGEERARIMWLTKDLRAGSDPRRAVNVFSDILSSSASPPLHARPAVATFVSFDIDAISGSDCPGVSCPGTVGLTAHEALQICELAGSNPSVQLMDLSEFNPQIEAYRTGRLVANMFYYFAMGFARRKLVAASSAHPSSV
jgi:formiminoglutamase